MGRLPLLVGRRGPAGRASAPARVFSTNPGGGGPLSRGALPRPASRRHPLPGDGRAPGLLGPPGKTFGSDALLDTGPNCGGRPALPDFDLAAERFEGVAGRSGTRELDSTATAGPRSASPTKSSSAAWGRRCWTCSPDRLSRVPPGAGVRTHRRGLNRSPGIDSVFCYRSQRGPASQLNAVGVGGLLTFPSGNFVQRQNKPREFGAYFAACLPWRTRRRAPFGAEGQQA